MAEKLDSIVIGGTEYDICGGVSNLPISKENIVNKFMGRILVIPNSDFSRNRIVKVDITKQVERTANDSSLNSSSTTSINNSSSKNND